jgi:hypothetical protein
VLENLDLQSRRAARDDLERALRGVVRTRKMDKHETRHSRVLKPRGHVGRLLIGQMTEWSSYALLEALRVRPSLEHLRAVVRLEQHQIAIRKESVEPSRGTTEIGHHGDPEGSRRNTDRNLRGVMRQADRLDDEGTEHVRAARRKRTSLHAATGPQKEPLIVRVERHPKRAREGARLR